MEWARRKIEILRWKEQVPAKREEREAAKERERFTAIEEEEDIAARAVALRDAAEKRASTAIRTHQTERDGSDQDEAEDTDEEALFFRDRDAKVNDKARIHAQACAADAQERSRAGVRDASERRTRTRSFRSRGCTSVSLDGHFVEPHVTTAISKSSLVKQAALPAVRDIVNEPFVVSTEADVLSGINYRARRSCIRGAIPTSSDIELQKTV